MSKKFSKITLALIFWGIFIYVVLNVPYPQTLTQASFFQLITFFATLIFAAIFTFNIFLTLVFSVLLSLGLVILLILKSLDILNLLTAGLSILAIILLLSYFKKTNQDGFSIKKLGFGSGIKKLKLSNRFKQVKLTTSRRRKRR